mgnify:CR=1 FL=1
MEYKKGDILVNKKYNYKVELKNIVSYEGQEWYKDYRNARYLLEMPDGKYINLSYERVFNTFYTLVVIRNKVIDGILL